MLSGWHLDVGEVAPVQDVICRNDAIKRQNMGGEGIQLIIFKGAGCLPGHGPTHIVKQGGGVGPVVANAPGGLTIPCQRLNVSVTPGQRSG